MVGPLEALEPLLAPPQEAMATFTPSATFERLMRLPGGSWVSSWSEQWRSACEMRHIAAMPQPDLELQLCASARSRKDTALEAQMLADLRSCLAQWRAQADAPDPQIEAAAQAVLALPGKDDRREAVVRVLAAAGPIAAGELEARVRELWRAARNAA